MKLYILFQINFQLISLLLQLSAPQTVDRRHKGGQSHLFSFPLEGERKRKFIFGQIKK